MAKKNFSMIYINENQQVVQEIFTYIPNCNIKQFINFHKIYDKWPELTNLNFGIFGKIQNYDYILQPGDRLEFYRKLHQDPKDLRKARQKEQLKSKN